MKDRQTWGCDCPCYSSVKFIEPQIKQKTQNASDMLSSYWHCFDPFHSQWNIQMWERTGTAKPGDYYYVSVYYVFLLLQNLASLQNVFHGFDVFFLPLYDTKEKQLLRMGFYQHLLSVF